MARVRHHTNDENLEKIRATLSIAPSRGAARVGAGVHVELEPFGSARPGLGGPKAELGTMHEGAYVEFDEPSTVVRTRVGPRNTAIIPTGMDIPLNLAGRNPRFVKVRRHWWELWRARPE